MKCYILGAVTGGSEDAEETFNTYKSALKDKVEILGTPLETAKFKGTKKERFARAEKAILQSDVVIAEMSVPSTGSGIEMGMAHLLGKPIYCCAKEGSNVSGLVVGMVGEEKVFYYRTLQELSKILKALNFQNERHNEL